MTERGLAYVMAVKATTSAYPGDAAPQTPPYSGRSRPPPRYAGNAANLPDLVLAAGRTNLRRVTWRQASKKTKGNPTAKMRSRFIAIRARSANRDIPRADDGSLPECWLLA
ncbi:transposase [Actinoallomurus sp. WRP9H-5]|nr:transposase [Actinoallomurus rhizosphaericola]